MTSITVAIIFFCLGYASAIKYFGQSQQKCVKEEDIENLLQEDCEPENFMNAEYYKSICAKGATYTYADLKPMPIEDNIEMMLAFAEGFKEYYGIDDCFDMYGNYSLYGCEHNAIPSYVKGEISIKGKDGKHSLKGSYYQEVVYEDGKVKHSHKKITTSMSEDVFKNIVKLMPGKFTLEQVKGIKKTSTEVFSEGENDPASEQSDYELENVETTTEASVSSTEYVLEPPDDDNEIEVEEEEEKRR